jgi:hypothetical protein
MRVMSRLASAAAGLAVAAFVQAQGTDELWQMSTKMEMEGMQMPAQSQQVCMKKGETQAEDLGQKDPNCKVTEQRRSGNKFTWKMVCTGREPMTGSGEMTRNRDTLDGRMLMKGKDGEMKISYAGKLSGTCDARSHKDPQVAAAQTQMAAIQAQGDAAIKQACNEAIEKFNTQFFEMQGGPCGPRKGEYCGRVKSTTQSMSTPAGYRTAMKYEGMRSGGWERAGAYCSVATAPARTAACKGAVGSRDWDIVGGYCPAEAKKIAAEHCAGRDYTAVMASEYKAVCQKYASRGAAGSTPAAAPAKPQEAATPSASDAVKEGTRALRKLFGN